MKVMQATETAGVVIGAEYEWRGRGWWAGRRGPVRLWRVRVTGVRPEPMYARVGGLVVDHATTVVDGAPPVYDDDPEDAAPRDCRIGDALHDPVPCFLRDFRPVGGGGETGG